MLPFTQTPYLTVAAPSPGVSAWSTPAPPPATCTARTPAPAHVCPGDQTCPAPVSQGEKTCPMWRLGESSQLQGNELVIG